MYPNHTRPPPHATRHLDIPSNLVEITSRDVHQLVSPLFDPESASESDTGSHEDDTFGTVDSLTTPPALGSVEEPAGHHEAMA
jgi:hypothetical protein